MTQKRILDALELVGEPCELIEKFADLKGELIGILGEPLYNLVLSLNNDDYKKSVIDGLNACGAEYITFFDAVYPENLREIPDFPLILYCKGDKALLGGDAFSVVGTRTPSAYGRRVTKEFAEELARTGFVIVSGLAKGVDAIAHRAALDNNMPTIAVLGTGIDVVYPAENRELAEKIAQNGLIITEYRPKTPPMNYHFPHRNRIISALSRSLLVTEAGENSGSLITVSYAVEQGKNIYIVPGNIYSPESKGANKYLKKLQAAIVTDINDILEDNNLKRKTKAESGIALDIMETLIVSELEKGEKHFDELTLCTGLEVSKLNSILTSLIIMGQIEETGSNYYSIAS